MVDNNFFYRVQSIFTESSDSHKNLDFCARTSFFSLEEVRNCSPVLKKGVGIHCYQQ